VIIISFGFLYQELGEIIRGADNRPLQATPKITRRKKEMKRRRRRRIGGRAVVLSCVCHVIGITNSPFFFFFISFGGDTITPKNSISIPKTKLKSN
jgi:hypothetical protein